ncbi:MAG: FMN-binding protein [Planctomycetes bacterium]|nr:FMN-binding protein [Planctomycetota bacterium]
MRRWIRHPGHLIGLVLTVAAALTLGAVALQVATADRMEHDRALRQDRALLSLFADPWGVADPAALPEQEVEALVAARVDRTMNVVDGSTSPPTDVPLLRVYATGRRERLLGIAFAAGGAGFWDRIDVVAAVTPDREHLVGVAIVDQHESPGLGDRVAEPAFLDQFSLRARQAAGAPPLPAMPPPDGKGEVLYVVRGGPTGPADARWGRAVDAITGATQTCTAIEQILNERLRQLHRTWATGLEPVE